MACNAKLYENITNILISAAILFTALAWRDCCVAWVDRNPYVKGKGPWTYAAVVTILALTVMVLLMFPIKRFACGSY